MTSSPAYSVGLSISIKRGLWQYFFVLPPPKNFGFKFSISGSQQCRLERVQSRIATAMFRNTGCIEIIATAFGCTSTTFLLTYYSRFGVNAAILPDADLRRRDDMNNYVCAHAKINCFSQDPPSRTKTPHCENCVTSVNLRTVVSIQLLSSQMRPHRSIISTSGRVCRPWLFSGEIGRTAQLPPVRLPQPDQKKRWLIWLCFYVRTASTCCTS